MNHIIHGELVSLLYAVSFSGVVTFGLCVVHHAAGFQYRYKWWRVLGLMLAASFAALTLVNVFVWTLL